MVSNQKIQSSFPTSNNITRVELDNGMIVMAYENSAVKSVNIMGSIHAGSIYEAREKNGLAAFVASALMTGTTNRNFDQIHSELEDIGADVSFRSHVHKVGVSGKALAEDLSVILDVAADSFRNPIFPEDHIERLRGERLTWLQYSSFNTRYRASRAMREVLYPDTHPYHYGTYGTENTIPELSVNDLKDYHARQYGPQGMILVIVGAVPADEAIEMVADKFGDWQNTAQPDVVEAPSVTESVGQRRTFVFVPGKSQADINMGVVGPSRYAKDYIAAQLANSVLGEFGMMGRIGKSVREEKGLAYYAYSRVGGGHGPDAWVVNAGVSPEDVELAIDSSLEEVERLITEEVSDDDIADNQSYFAGRLPLRLESNEGISSHIHGMESYNLGLDYLKQYRDKIYNITKADMLTAAQRYLKPDNMVIAVAGPEYANYKPITPKQTVPIRSEILRPGQPEQNSIYPLDEDENALHLGAIKNSELVGVASIFKEAATRKDLTDAWRLRGMATIEAVRGEGHGKQLVETAIQYIAFQGGGNLWFNARHNVQGFYENLGFQVEGDPYEISEGGERIFMWQTVDPIETD
jgi:zinc protease